MFKKVILILMISASFLIAKKIDAISFSGYNDGDKLKSVIGIKVGDTYSAKKVSRAKKIIIKALEASGYHNNVVESKISNKGSTVGVTFDINRGNKIIITKITFNGNKNVPEEELTANLVNKEAQFMGWFPGRNNGNANASQLKYDGMRVQDEYLKRGYLDAKVSDPLMRVDPSTYNATISYSIKEGRSYKVSSVSVLGLGSTGVSKSEIGAKLGLKARKVFNVQHLRDDIKMISETIGNLGYAYAKVAPAFKKNAKNRTISVSYRVKPGKKVTIGDVTVTGNTKTKDNVVRRYVYQAPGDLYNYSDFKASQKALQRTGFFESATVKAKKAKGNKIDLVVDVKEAKTGAFTVGGGYSSVDGFMVNGSISEKNIMGTGIEVSAAVDYSNVKNSFSLSFKEPRLFDSKYSLSAGIYKSQSDYSDTVEYDNLGYNGKDEMGGFLSVGRQFNREIYASIGYRYGVVEYTDVDTNLTTNPGYVVGDYLDYVKSSFIASLTFDNTDNYYNPREGIYANLNLEYAGVGSAPAGKQLAEYTRLDLKFAAFYGLQDEIDYDLIFRYKFRAGYMGIDAGDYVPRAEKLYLGGSSRGVRGYASGSISPFIGDNIAASLEGGTKSMVNSIEASIPLSEASKMRLTFFADHGMIGRNNLDEITKKSVGAQVEWQSPFGPINLVFAKAIDPEPYDKTAEFEFSMGSKF